MIRALPPALSGGGARFDEAARVPAAGQYPWRQGLAGTARVPAGGPAAAPAAAVPVRDVHGPRCPVHGAGAERPRRLPDPGPAHPAPADRLGADHRRAHLLLGSAGELLRWLDRGPLPL